MSLQILIAGCLPGDRGRIEDLVKKAFGELPESDPWSASLVKLGSSWSVSLNGPTPELTGISLTASEDVLQETIASAVRSNGQPSAPTSPLSLEELEEAEGLLLGVSPGPAEVAPGGAAEVAAAGPVEVAARGPAEVRTGGPAEVADQVPAGGTGPAKAPDCYDCPACGHGFRVVYVSQNRERMMRAPVACPVCWELTDVLVPESAAATQEYRAEET